MTITDNNLLETLAMVRARALVRGLAKVEPKYGNDAVFIEAMANRLAYGPAGTVRSLAEWLAKSGDKAAMARFRESVIRQAKQGAPR
jgi:hypothetical protein